MRQRLIIFALLTAVLLMAGHTTANPYTRAPNTTAAYFLPLVRHDSPAQPLPSATITATATSMPTPSVTPSPTASATPVTSVTLAISGTVFVKPRWAIQQMVPPAPVAYQIILDTSGSMSWNFAGQGSQGGMIQFEADTQGASTTVQCETTAQDPNAVSCIGGPADPWWKLDERRLYIVKQALTGAGGLIDALQPNDLMQVIAYNSLGVQAGPGWSGDKALLKTTILNSGSYQSDRYRSDGGTNSADAIERARQMLADTPPPAPNGQPYRQVTIFLTDGIANIFLSSHNGGHALTNYALDVCPEFAGDRRAFNTPRCQYDALGYPASPFGERPISAMLTQANLLKQIHPELPLYAIGIGNVTPFGLDQVASNADMFYLAPNAAGLAQTLATIQNQIVGSAQTSCIPAGSNTWIGKIDAAHTADSPPLPSLPFGVYGYVYLTNDQGQPVSVPWNGPGADPRGGVTNMIPIVTDLNGNMTYVLPPSAGLTAGNYYLTGYVNYKAANADPTAGGDGQSRQYSRLMQDGLPVQNVSFTLTPSQVLGSSIVIDPLHLDLNLNVNLCG